MTSDVTIYIDGRKIVAPAGQILIETARSNGIMIPGLCYHKRITPTGACRLCVCKIKGMNGLVASCTVRITEGMEITAYDDELEEARRFLLDYLLSEHNEEFDGSYDDEFRQLKKQYNLDDPANRKFPSIWKELNYPVDKSSPILAYDASKCIKCFRCIKACDEVQGKNVLSFANRGVTSYIIAGFDNWKESECDGCGECIQLCPTGAIVETLHRDKIDLKKIDSKIISTCPYCGVGCQIEMIVQDGRIVRVNGAEGLPPNDGRLCVKGRFGYDFVHSPERLTTPLIKRNGKFESASWEEALDLIASKFSSIKDEHGSQALAGYSSAKCTNEDNYLFQKFVRLVFGNNNVDYCTRLCHASTVVAMLRSIGDGAGSNSIEDYVTADCILVTGNNMIETHPVTATFVKQGKKRGAKLIVIDPKWTPLVKHADIWLQPRLGSDVALLNGMMNVIIERGLANLEFIENRVEGGMESFNQLREITRAYTPEYTEELTSVPAASIVRAAILFAQSKKSIVATGMGLSQQVTGTNNVFTLINMLLITGHLGKVGSGINPPRGQNNVQGASDVGTSPLTYPGYIPVGNDENRRRVAEIWNVPYEALSGKPGLTTVEIMKAAYTGEIKGMYIMGENPMLTDPNLNHTEEAIKNLEFLVVQDIFHTETTPFADVILPAASFAEKNGTFVNSDRRVLRVRKAVESPGEARQDWKIILDIAGRMGTSLGNYENESEIFDEIALAAPMMAGISFNRIEHKGIQWPCPDKNHPGTSTLFIDKFNTPSGRAKLNPVEHIEQKEKADLDFPFILNSGRILYQYHSATMSRKNSALNDFSNEAYVLMHPSDAEKNGLNEGITVRLTSRRGKLETILRISEEVAPGELFMPFHYCESAVNRLTSDELDPHSKIAPFKLSACRVEAVVAV
jgi:formate dehydrogenase alpha subunit